MATLGSLSTWNFKIDCIFTINTKKNQTNRLSNGMTKHWIIFKAESSADEKYYSFESYKWRNQNMSKKMEHVESCAEQLYAENLHRITG